MKFAFEFGVTGKPCFEWSYTGATLQDGVIANFLFQRLGHLIKSNSGAENGGGFTM